MELFSFRLVRSQNEGLLCEVCRREKADDCLEQLRACQRRGERGLLFATAALKQESKKDCPFEMTKAATLGNAPLLQEDPA